MFSSVGSTHNCDSGPDSYKWTSAKCECSGRLGKGGLRAEPRAFRSKEGENVRMERFRDGREKKVPRSPLKRIALEGKALERSVDKAHQPRSYVWVAA